MNSVMPGPVMVSRPVKARRPSRWAISGRNGSAAAAWSRNGFIAALTSAG